MNNKLWYINAALIIALAAIWITGIMAGPDYPSKARFKAPATRAGSGENDISNMESETVLAARGFSHWLDPPPAFGTLTVTIEPEDARKLGAAWRVGGNTWLNSGDKDEKISPGKKILTFKSIDEWISPKITAEVKKDLNTEITAVYTLPPQGTVKIVIEPEEVLKLKPQWKIGNGQWLDSGQESQKTAVGKKNIVFKDIEGWDKPSVAVDITEDNTTEITASYEIIRYGEIYVSLEPKDNPALSVAKWSIDKKNWNNFGAEPVKTRLGSYTVSFKDVADWDKPDDYKLNMEEETAYEIIAEYLPIPYAQVKIELKPANDDRISSAQWRIDNGPWLNFDQIGEKVTLKEHKISFKNVEGWTKPDDVQLNVEEEITYDMSCEYVRIKPPGPKFEIVTVIETGGGNGVAFINNKEGYKVGEIIQDFKLIAVGQGKAFFEKEGFEYELQIKKTDPPVAPVTQKVNSPVRPPATPEKNRPGRPELEKRDIQEPPLIDEPGRNIPDRSIPGKEVPERSIPNRPSSFRRPQTTRS